MFFKLVLIILINVAFSHCGMIPGSSCGSKTRIQYVDSLSPTDDINNLACAVVRDEESFRKHYMSKKISMCDE